MGNRYEIMKSMHTIICAMNNEDAYSSWIYIVPDEASDDDLMPRTILPVRGLLCA